MRKFAYAIAVAGALTTGSSMAAENEWGAWNTPDALPQILAANHDLDARGNPRLGPDDSAASDAGGLLSSLIGGVLDESGLTLSELVSDLDDLADLNQVLNDLPADLPVGAGDVGGVIDDVAGDVCVLIAC